MKNSNRQQEVNIKEGIEKLIPVKDQPLGEGLIAINQYLNQTEIFNYRGYKMFNTNIRKQTIDEKHFPEWLEEQVIYFKKTLALSRPKLIKTIETVTEMMNNLNEVNTLCLYNRTIEFAPSIDDQGSDDLFSKIWKKNGSHIDWAEI